jgi:hypothetical protein
MNVEIGAEAVQFPETECINGIFIAVRQRSKKNQYLSLFVSADDAGMFSETQEFSCNYVCHTAEYVYMKA